ncbi:MAG: repair protein RadC [Candidatus Poribacteria bacterium]|nr:repair protein RadC [Candidatus Poribacteria bacterium]
MSKTDNIKNHSKEQIWHHPGGKLLELGAESLSDAELISILIGSGIKGKPAEKIAEELILKYGSLKGLAGKPLEDFQKIKGLGEVKVLRIAAALEIAKRCVNLIINELKEDDEFRKEVFGVK